MIVGAYYQGGELAPSPATASGRQLFQLADFVDDGGEILYTWSALRGRDIEPEQCGGRGAQVTSAAATPENTACAAATFEKLPQFMHASQRHGPAGMVPVDYVMVYGGTSAP